MDKLIDRVKRVIDNCWESFSAKVGGGLISINKEASMQLQFAYLLKNVMDLTLHHNDESVSIELETGIPLDGRMRECDIVIQVSKGVDSVLLPIEMKCYKEFAASGGKRGASDVFMKDVYVDIELIESYQKNKEFINGMVLVMTDLKRLPHPDSKNGKKWNYDISDGTKIVGGTSKNTPIGGQSVDLILKGSYRFNWEGIGDYYFLKLENND